MMSRKMTAWAGGVLLLAGVTAVRAEEKPAASTGEAPAVSMEQLAQAITGYSQKDAELKGGYFLVYDPVTKKPLQLTLDKVHYDKLARVHEGEYFACADYKAPDGTVYDLDVFMKGDSLENLQVTEVTVHKLNGKPRYGWYEENGKWIKK